jgi:hypothetical protein
LWGFGHHVGGGQPLHPIYLSENWIVSNGGVTTSYSSCAGHFAQR